MKKLLSLVIAYLVTFGGLSGQELSDSLSASYAIPKGRVKEIVSNAAKDFGRRHARNYISLARYERIVQSESCFCQLLISEGLFGAFNFNQNDVKKPWEDLNMGRYYALNSLMSLFRIPGTIEYSKTIAMSNQEVRGFDSFFVNYNQYQGISPVARMRSMELFGPINQKKIKYYDFELANYSPDREIYTVHFSSKQKVFPKKIRLCGEGLLFISLKQGILGFKITDMEDRFTSFVNITSENLMESVTPYTMEVRYKQEQGRILPDHLIQVVKWKRPLMEDRDIYYCAENNPYRDPFANKISSSSRVVFYNSLILNQQEAQNISDSFPPSYTGWRPCMEDDDPTCPMPDIRTVRGFVRIRTDLEALGVRLENQTPIQRELYEEYCNSINSGQSTLAKDREKTLVARQIYGILYK